MCSVEIKTDKDTLIVSACGPNYGNMTALLYCGDVPCYYSSFQDGPSPDEQARMTLYAAIKLRLSLVSTLVM